MYAFIDWQTFYFVFIIKFKKIMGKEIETKYMAE